MQWASLSLGAQEPQHRHGGEQVEPGGEVTGVFAVSKTSHQWGKGDLSPRPPFSLTLLSPVILWNLSLSFSSSSRPPLPLNPFNSLYPFPPHQAQQ